VPVQSSPHFFPPDQSEVKKKKYSLDIRQRSLSSEKKHEDYGSEN